MKKADANDCDVQVLVCTNERPEGKSCCKKFGGQEFYDKLKRTLKETGENSHIWATRTGCLGFCNDVGTVVAIHRKGQTPEWYDEVTAGDFDAIYSKLKS